MSDYALRHISIRVPGHDAVRSGVVCLAPLLNGACAKLKRITRAKREHAEVLLAARSFDELAREQWPCCVEERACASKGLDIGSLQKLIVEVCGG